MPRTLKRCSARGVYIPPLWGSRSPRSFTQSRFVEPPFVPKCNTDPVLALQFGSNPAGITTSLSRRVEILHLARKYDLIIMEDDPYYFLYYGDGPRPTSYFALDRVAGATPLPVPLSSDGGAGHAVERSWRNGGDTEVDARLGRVLRMDSFSKIVSAGFRLGWVTGPDVLIRAIESHVRRSPTSIFLYAHFDFRVRQQLCNHLLLPKWWF